MENTLNNSGLTFFNIKGAKVKIRFGLPACRKIMELFLSDAATDYINADNTLTELGIAKMLYFGYANSCLVDEQEQTLKYVDFVDCVEERALDSNGVEIQEVVTVWGNSRSTISLAKSVGEQVEAIEKKNSASKSIRKRGKR